MPALQIPQGATIISGPHSPTKNTASGSYGQALVLYGVHHGGKHKCFKNTLIVPYHKDGPFLEVQMPSLGIDAWGETVDDLRDSAIEQLAMLFDEYVDAEDTSLAEGALELKHRLQALIGN